DDAAADAGRVGGAAGHPRERGPHLARDAQDDEVPLEPAQGRDDLGGRRAQVILQVVDVPDRIALDRASDHDGPLQPNSGPELAQIACGRSATRPPRLIRKSGRRAVKPRVVASSVAARWAIGMSMTTDRPSYRAHASSNSKPPPSPSAMQGPTCE